MSARVVQAKLHEAMPRADRKRPSAAGDAACVVLQYLFADTDFQDDAQAEQFLTHCLADIVRLSNRTAYLLACSSSRAERSAVRKYKGIFDDKAMRDRTIFQREWPSDSAYVALVAVVDGSLPHPNKLSQHMLLADQRFMLLSKRDMTPEELRETAESALFEYDAAYSFVAFDVAKACLERCEDGDLIVRCLQAHTGQLDWVIQIAGDHAHVEHLKSLLSLEERA